MVKKSTGRGAAGRRIEGRQDESAAGFDHAGVSQSGSTAGARSPMIAAGAGSRNINQLGDHSVVHIGDFLDQLPPTSRESEKPAWGATWGLRAAAIIALVANIATVSGLNVGSLKIAGIWPSIREAFDGGLLSGSAPRFDPVAFFVFTASVMVILQCGRLWLQLRQRKYVRSMRGRIYERKGGRVLKSRLSGACPIPHCGGPLRLRRVEIGRESYQGKDANGNPVMKERAKKGDRLVCQENADHYFRFDRTNVRNSETGRASSPSR